MDLKLYPAARYLKVSCNFTWADMHSLILVSCFSMNHFTFDNNSKNLSRDILIWFEYISASSLVYSTNKVLDAHNVLCFIIHGLTQQRRFFFFFIFFFKYVEFPSLNSHISQQHIPAQVHLQSFWNRLPRSLLWNCVKYIVQTFNSISFI